MRKTGCVDSNATTLGDGTALNVEVEWPRVDHPLLKVFEGCSVHRSRTRSTCHHAPWPAVVLHQNVND
jgi:hypothetical protein